MKNIRRMYEIDPQTMLAARLEGAPEVGAAANTAATTGANEGGGSRGEDAAPLGVLPPPSATLQPAAHSAPSPTAPSAPSQFRHRP